MEGGRTVQLDIAILEYDYGQRVEAVRIILDHEHPKLLDEPGAWRHLARAGNDTPIAVGHRCCPVDLHVETFNEQCRRWSRLKGVPHNRKTNWINIQQPNQDGKLPHTATDCVHSQDLKC